MATRVLIVEDSPLMQRLLASLIGAQDDLKVAGIAVDPIDAPNAQGLVKVSGVAQEGASVGVLNDTTMNGVIVTTASDGCDPACRYEAEIEASAGDSLRVWQFFETTQARDVQVP